MGSTHRAPTGAAGPWSTATLMALGFFAGLATGAGCATSDQVLEGQRELEVVEAEASSRAECKPGLEEPCYSGPEGTAGRGICKEGTRACNAEGLWQQCKGAVLPEKELCNRVDDDCDGIVDNGFEREGALCFRGQGACRSKGQWKCSADGTSSECDAPIIKPSKEVCDNVDNDCDGEIDDGAVEGTGDACSTGKAGVCNAGTKRCVGGRIQCVQNQTPSIEICNKLDDDCDNQVDEECLTEEEAREARNQQ